MGRKCAAQPRARDHGGGSDRVPRDWQWAGAEKCKAGTWAGAEKCKSKVKRQSAKVKARRFCLLTLDFPPAGCQLPSASGLPLSAYCLLPTAYCFLPSAYCSSPALARLGPSTPSPRFPRLPPTRNLRPARPGPQAEWKPSQPQDQVIRGKWWEIFDDPQLNALEERVDVSNQNLKIAEAQFRQARDQIRIDRSGCTPRSAPAPTLRGNNFPRTLPMPAPNTAKRRVISSCPLTFPTRWMPGGGFA